MEPEEDLAIPTEIAAAPGLTLQEFLETRPPGAESEIENAFETFRYTQATNYKLKTPVLHLYCSLCKGIRMFEKFQNEDYLSMDEQNFVGVRYVCRNCRREYKIYSLFVDLKKTKCRVYKFGELPEFGPPIPPKVVSLIGSERDYFFKGRRCENQGLGIAAFAYYRRVVENQKNRILDEIIRVCKRVGAQAEMINDIEAAKNETQFHKAIDGIRHGVPEGLLVKGHNPLSLLHSALSEGLHAQEDTECLELATSIRVVLVDLADRLDSALKDRAELDTAVSKLLSAKTKKSDATKPQ